MLAIACTQGEGETCQTNRDCDDGLVCLRAPNSERSVCGSPDEVDDAGSNDAGDPDLPPDEDAGEVPADAGDEDAGSEPTDEDAG